MCYWMTGESDVNYFVFRKGLSNVLKKECIFSLSATLSTRNSFYSVRTEIFLSNIYDGAFLRKYLKTTVVICIFKNTPSSIFDRILNTSEGVAQRCSVKKVLLEVSQNSQENTCALSVQLYLKKYSGTGIFLRILRNF